MSQFAIKQYQAEVEKIIHYGGTKKETAIRNAFYNLLEYLIDSPASTFCVRVSGNSMTGAGINNGDILIVDRSKRPKNNGIIIGVINGDFTVKRVRKTKEGLFLVPENPNYKAMKIDDCMDFSIWGVVTYIIHKA